MSVNVVYLTYVCSSWYKWSSWNWNDRGRGIYMIEFVTRLLSVIVVYLTYACSSWYKWSSWNWNDRGRGIEVIELMSHECPRDVRMRIISDIHVGMRHIYIVIEFVACHVQWVSCSHHHGWSREGLKLEVVYQYTERLYSVSSDVSRFEWESLVIIWVPECFGEISNSKTKWPKLICGKRTLCCA